MRARDDGAAVLRAAFEPSLQLLDRGRQDEDADEIVARLLAQLLGALPIDVEQDIAAGPQCLLHRLARRAVAMAEDFRPFQKLAGFHHGLEAGQVDEMIVAAVDLAADAAAASSPIPKARRAASAFSNMRESVVLPAPDGEDRTSIRPRRATRLLDFAARALMPYSTFCTCSRNCSTAALSSSPILVSSTSLALAQSVLASRLSSCARKSSRRPIAPP